MLVSRNLGVVARYSRNSIIMMLFLSGTMITLAGVALWQGKAAPVHVLPRQFDPNCPKDCGGPVNLLVAVLSVLSVSCLAFTCQVGAHFLGGGGLLGGGQGGNAMADAALGQARDGGTVHAPTRPSPAVEA